MSVIKTNPFLEEYIKDNEKFFYTKTTKILTDREFVKVYINANDKLANLTNSTKLLFEYLFRNLQKTESYNKTIIDISFKTYVIFSNINNIKVLSKATFYRCREELIRNRIIAETDNNSFYYFNLNLFFNGDRILLATEYLRQTTNIVQFVQPIKQQEESKEPEGYKQSKKSAFQC